jgi:hypothetical protein
MRKSVLLIVISLWVAANSYAQEEERKVFSGGLIPGANFTQVDGDSYYGYHKIGLNVGGTVYVHFTGTFGASMELIYTQKGSRAETVEESPYSGTYVSQYHINVNYVEVPITFHYIIRKYDFEAGAAYARLVGSREWAYTDIPINIDPVINSFNNFDIEYVFGAGRKLYKRLYANFRFQYSITSIRPLGSIPPGYSWGVDGQYNNIISLRVIYYL